MPGFGNNPSVDTSSIAEPNPVGCIQSLPEKYISIRLFINMKSLLITLLFLLLPFSAFAKDKHGDIYSYLAEDDFETVVDSIRQAITDQGLDVRSVLHISDMINRTAKDLGFNAEVYLHAESVEFCSTKLVHMMSEAHPLNMSACPFTIAVFEEKKEPGKVKIAYMLPRLIGDTAEVEQNIVKMLDGIVLEAIE